MKNLIYNNTILIFLDINDVISFKKNDLKLLKNNYLKTYDNCIIYNFFDLKNKKNIIKDKINKLKFYNQKKIFSRKCNIRIIDNIVKNEFLNNYHIQGTDKSQIFYGAFYDDELIAVMTFDYVKGMQGGLNENEYDLSRFAIKRNYIIVGIFNKILKKFINDYSPKKIISFADLNYVNKNNNIYEASGFKLNKILSSDFKYLNLKNNKIYHKLTFGRKHVKKYNLNDNEKKELYDGLKKVWDCGKLKYELFLENNKIIFGFIYQIKNLINNKIYIGQTTRNLNKRIYEYKSAYNKQFFYNLHLLNAFNKYGFNNFEFSIIDTAENIEELNKKEIDYIIKYKSNNKEFGYNIENGGRNSIPNEETLKKMSASHSGIKQTDEWIRKRVAKAGSEEAKKYGKVKTEEEKKYLSKNSGKYWLGKKRDHITKLKISQTKKINGLSSKQKKILCKKVIAYDCNSEKILNIFDSTIDASKFYNISQSTISRRCCGKSKNKGNVFFKYQ